MAAGIFDVALGRIVRYADLIETGDQLVAVLLQSGQEADGTLEGYATLSALLAAANTEATFTGYSQQDLTTVNVDEGTPGQISVDCDDPSWSPTTAQSLGKIVICYDPDGTNTAANMVPLFHDDFAITTPTSGTITYQVATGGFVTSS